MIHTLGYKAFSISVVQQAIVRKGLAGQGIDGGIANDDG